MKKIIYIVFCSLLVITLSGCDKKEENTNNDDISTKQEQTIQIFENEHTMKVGELYSINVNIAPNDNDEYHYLSYTMDDDIGTISNNTFLATKEGETNITVSNGKDSAKIKIKVIK